MLVVADNRPNLLCAFVALEMRLGAQGTEYLNIFLEYLDGGSLRSRLQAEGSMSEEQTADVTRKLLGGLCYLHAQGITHRDIKVCALPISRQPHAALSQRLRNEVLTGKGIASAGRFIFRRRPLLPPRRNA